MAKVARSTGLRAKAVVAVVGALVLAGGTITTLSWLHGRPTHGEFVATDHRSFAVHVAWIKNGSRLTGSGNWSDLDTSTGVLSSNAFKLQGSVSGSDVSLSLGSGGPFAGSVDSSGLTLTLPMQDGSLQTLALPEGTVADYNHALAQLRSEGKRIQDQVAEANREQANLDAAAQRLADAWNAVTDDAWLAGDAGYLAPRLSADASAMKDALANYQAVAAGTPGFKTSIDVPEDSQVQSELSCIDYLVEWFNANPDYRPGVQAPPSSC